MQSQIAGSKARPFSGDAGYFKSPPQIRHELSRRDAVLSCHHHIAKSDKLGGRKNLGEDVGEVQLGVNMNRYENVLVAKRLHPFLTSIDVLKAGLVGAVVGESFCGSVVHLKLDRERKVNIHLTCDV
jgi:hypothetical protein